MRKIVKIILLLSCGWSNAQWEGKSATVLPNGRHEIGLFSPFKMGLRNTSEISVNKFLLMPSISYKSEMSQSGAWERAYRLQFTYPTLAMRWLQSPLGMKLGEPDKFALISPEFTIPHMLSFYGEIIGTKNLPGNGIITLYGGAGFALGTNKLENRATIDLPGFYPRLSVYYNGVVLKTGSEYLYQLGKSWSYIIDYDMFIMPNSDGRYAFEHKGLIVWAKNQKFRILFGYKLFAGEYPFGSQAHLIPMLDLQFGW